MSESYPPPPRYEDVKGTGGSKRSNNVWEQWFRRLISLKLTQDEATEYARLLTSNDIEISMIPELNDSILKSIGIEKAGHRIRILRLQNQAVSAAVSGIRLQDSASSLTVPRCAWHPHVAASEKCRSCNRLVCLNCRREKYYADSKHYYCQNCASDCTIL